MLHDPHLIAAPGTTIRLENFDPGYTNHINSKDEAKALLKANTERLKKIQNKLYAFNKYAVLVIFQAMDAAGKDSTIKSVMSGVNPQGCQVYSFKHPSTTELDHDYMWRSYNALPERGRIGIFNRSYYEDVLIARVHPNIIMSNRIPGVDSIEAVNEEFWQARYRQIRQLEKHLTENGTVIIKFFLHLSKEEQARRFLRRIEDERKNWKFSASDMAERQHWDSYQLAYEQCIKNTSTDHAPWYIIPADRKWFMRTAVSEIITERIEALNPVYPTLPEKDQSYLATARKQLLTELGEMPE